MELNKAFLINQTIMDCLRKKVLRNWYKIFSDMRSK